MGGQGFVSVESSGCEILTCSTQETQTSNQLVSICKQVAPIFELKSGCRVYTSRFVRFILLDVHSSLVDRFFRLSTSIPKSEP